MRRHWHPLGGAVVAFFALGAGARAGFASGAGWSDTDLGGAPASEPSAASDGQRRWVYFGGVNGHLWGVAHDVGVPFGAPFDTGVALKGAPSAIVLGPTQVRVFFRGSNDHLSYVDGDGVTFGSVTDLGGLSLTSSPSAVVRASGHVAAFYRGPNGNLTASLWDGGPWWSAPQDLGVAIAASPAAVVPYGDSNGLEVYSPDARGELARSVWNGTSWKNDVALARVAIHDPVTAVSRTKGTTTLFYRQGGELVRRSSLAGSFAGPEAMRIMPASGPGACATDEVFFTGSNKHLHRAARVPSVVFPTYDKVWGTADHNAYWVNRNHFLDPYASGTQELLSDQLLHEHVRALEIDVHSDDGNPGVWSIYHTDTPSNSFVHNLKDLTDELRAFHYAVPDHEAINIIIELKNTNVKIYPPLASEETFLPDHTIDQFDQTFRDAFGDALYTPSDLLARAAPGSTLARAAQVAGWPTTDELRGKFILNVIGNWSNAYHDWFRYAGESDIALRAGFPLRSMLDDSGNGLCAWPGNAHDSIPSAWTQPAFDASVFWQVEDLTCPLVPDFLKRNGVVRGADSFVPIDQEDRLTRGFQLVQTDYPWNMTGDTAPAGLPTDPSRRFRDPTSVTSSPPIDRNALQEPGTRLYVSTDTTARFLYSKVAAGSTRWLETTVSTTRIGDTYGLSYPRKAQEGGVGGLRAAVSSGEFLEILRVKTGQSGDGPDQEKLTLRVGISHGGSYTRVDRIASPYGADDVGNLIALGVDASANGSVVRVYSAGRLDANGNPVWTLLRTESFAGAAIYQGLVATKDVLFVGSRWSQTGGGSGALGLASLPFVSDAATLVNLSWPNRSTAQPAVVPVP